MDVNKINATDPNAGKQSRQQRDTGTQQNKQNQAQSSPQEATSVEVDLDREATRLYRLVEANLPDPGAIMPWFSERAYPRNNALLLNIARTIQHQLSSSETEPDINPIIDQLRKQVLQHMPWIEPPYEDYRLKTGTALEIMVKKAYLFPPQLLMTAEQQLLAYWLERLDDDVKSLQTLSLMVLEFTVDRWRRQRTNQPQYSLSLDVFTETGDKQTVLGIPPALRARLQGAVGTPA